MYIVKSRACKSQTHRLCLTFIFVCVVCLVRVFTCGLLRLRCSSCETLGDNNVLLNCFAAWLHILHVAIYYFVCFYQPGGYYSVNNITNKVH